jgi:PhnB protein
MPNPIPEGYRTITPYLRMKGAADAIAFYKKVFGAEEVMRMPGPTGAIMHAEMRIGDSMLMLSDEFKDWGTVGPQTLGGTSVGLHLYVADVDALFKRATDAGCQPMMPPTNMFWGDRMAKLKDPFGHEWAMATHVEDVPPSEMGKRAEAAMKEMCPGAKK